MRTLSPSSAAAALLAIALLTPATSASEAEPPGFSGFLGDYSTLEPGPKGGPLLLFVKEQDVLASYDAFLIDPVLAFFHEDSAGAGVDPADLEMLTRFLRDEAVEQLKAGSYRLAEEPGPGVALIRAAITDINGIKPGRNLGLKVAGIAGGVGLLMPSIDIGRASLEVEILDSTSGERLVAIVDAVKGRRFFNLSGASRTFGDVKKAFKGWAKDLRQQLDRAHQRQEDVQ